MSRPVFVWLAMWALIAITVAGCSIPLRIDAGQELCVAEWSKEFALRAGAEADALPEGSALREVVAQYVDIRKKARRC
jgi:hypothetical protein